MNRQGCGDATGERLIDLVKTPEEVIDARGSLKVHALYYITKQINPSLQVCTNTLGSIQYAAVPDLRFCGIVCIA